MHTLGQTESVCPTCRALVPAKVITDGRDVYFEKFCPGHGRSREFVRADAGEYLRSARFVKPAWVPREFAGDASVPCPHGCGFCPRHEQHLCMPIVEITSRCDLACPACIADAGPATASPRRAGQPWDMTLEQFRHALDRLIAAEGQIDVLTLSGGEPLLHPRILDFADELSSRPQIIRFSVSTNGLRLLAEPDLLARLAERNVCISLQFDGFSQRAYEVLRGRPLLDEKLRLLDLLASAGVATSLTMTVAGGVNDDQFAPALDYLFAQGHVVSMMIQPLAFAGRGADLAGRAGRLTIPDVIRLLDSAGDRRVRAADFVPLPCSDPRCFSLAYYLLLDGGGAVSVAGLLDAATVMDVAANRTIFGLDPEEHRRVKDLIYELWSGPAGTAPDGQAVLRTLRAVLDELSCCCFDPRKAFGIAERRMKSIFIHAFQDAGNFDLARARRCCNAYVQPDGRLIPACVHNVLGGRP